MPRRRCRSTPAPPAGGAPPRGRGRRQAPRAPAPGEARGQARSRTEAGLRASSRGGQQLFERGPLRLREKERLVRGVLEQPAHEIRHACDEIPDRAVDPRPESLCGERGSELIAKAAERLEL